MQDLLLPLDQRKFYKLRSVKRMAIALVNTGNDNNNNTAVLSTGQTNNVICACHSWATMFTIVVIKLIAPN